MQTFALHPARGHQYFPRGNILSHVLLVTHLLGDSTAVASILHLDRRGQARPFIYFDSFSLSRNKGRAICLETCANFLSFAVCGTQELPVKVSELLDLSE